MHSPFDNPETFTELDEEFPFDDTVIKGEAEVTAVEIFTSYLSKNLMEPGSFASRQDFHLR